MALDKSQQNKLVIGILPILCLFLFNQYMHAPKAKENAKLERRLESLETSNSAARTKAAKGGVELEKKLALYREHIQRLEQLVPQEEEVPELLRTMAQNALETGVDLKTLRPADAEPGQFYTRQTYEFGAIGAYHQLASFITSIGTLPRIVTATNVALTPTREKTRTGAQQVEAMFRIETYVIPKNPPPPPADSAGGPNKGRNNAR